MDVTSTVAEFNRKTNFEVWPWIGDNITAYPVPLITVNEQAYIKFTRNGDIY